MTEDAAVRALIRAHVACQLAIDAIPDLPPRTADAIREPMRELCQIVGGELERIRPDSGEI